MLCCCADQSVERDDVQLVGGSDPLSPPIIEVLDEDEAAARAEAETSRLLALGEHLLAAGSAHRSKAWQVYGGPALEKLFAHTAVVDALWLLRFAKGQATIASWKPARSSGRKRPVVPPWQHLPPESLVPLEVLQCWQRDELPVGVLSYGWAAKGHPDPFGEQLQNLVPALEAIVAAFYEGPHACAFGLIWDFLSLPQRGYTVSYDPDRDDRTPEQLARFKLGLKAINEWYGHPYVHTLVMTTPMPASAENAAPIQRRGWCIFERRISSIVKHGSCYLELGRPWRRELGFVGLKSACSKGRAPPMAPDAFEAMLSEGVAREAAEPGSGIKFTSGKDLTDVVIPQYAKGFVRLLGGAEKLSYTSLGWGDDETAQLAAALTYAQAADALSRLASLQLYLNRIGDDGLRALLAAFEAGAAPALQTLHLHENCLTAAGLNALRLALEAGVLPKLSSLEVGNNESGASAAGREAKAALTKRLVAAAKARREAAKNVKA